MKTTVQLTPAEYLHGIYTGIYSGHELMERNDVQTILMRDYLGNIKHEGDVTVILGIRCTVFALANDSEHWGVLTRAYDVSTAASIDVCGLLHALIDGHFSKFLVDRDKLPPQLFLLDVIIASICYINWYRNSINIITMH